MECKEFKELISQYIDNELPEEQMSDMREHLELCVACKREYEELAKIKTLLNQTEEISLPADFDLRMRKALAPEFAKAKADRRRKKLMRKASAIAAVFVLGITGIVMAGNADMIFEKFETSQSVDQKELISETVNDVSEKAENDVLPDEAEPVTEAENKVAYSGNEDAYTAAEAYASQAAQAVMENENEKQKAIAEDFSDETGQANNAEEDVSLLQDEYVYDAAEENMIESESGRSVAPSRGDGSQCYRQLVMGFHNNTDLLKDYSNNPFCNDVGGSAAINYYKKLINEALADKAHEVTGYCQTDYGKWIFNVKIYEENDNEAEDEEVQSLIYKCENGNIMLVNEQK